MKTFKTYIEAIDYSAINPSETVEYKEYYSDGQLDEHSFYVAGELHGEFKSYFKNGLLYDHCFFVDGIRNGECKWYHSNGQLSYHCFYVNGKRHGEFKTYHSNGKICKHCFYVNGKKIKLDHLKDSSYKSRCVLITLFDGNLFDEDI